MKYPTAILLALLIASCASTPPGPPDVVANNILTALEDGNTSKAERLFDEVASEENHREKIYPVLYGKAKASFEAGERESSVSILRFMRAQYPDAYSVREALLYELFIERAGQATADPELVKEIDETLGEMPGATPSGSLVQLVSTQNSIDRGDIEGALVSFEQFLTKWNGTPAALTPYVEDIDRYLASH